MIRVVDYGLGNITAFLNVYKRLNIEAGVAKSAEDLKSAEKLILPGVGAFDHAMQRLNASGMRESLEEHVLGRKVPLLGVCVGMQMLAYASEEGVEGGLGFVPGNVRNLRHLLKQEQLPHMGWNDVQPVGEQELFRGLQNASFYFLHSFYFECERNEDVAALTHYGRHFCCAVRSANIYGAQFHPEKSHHFGAQLLKNFAEL
jgi:imidazole glycerol-phosphate synthase subunit HisH